MKPIYLCEPNPSLPRELATCRVSSPFQPLCNKSRSPLHQVPSPPSAANIDARGPKFARTTQTVVLATSGWSEISSLYANPGRLDAMRIAVQTANLVGHRQQLLRSNVCVRSVQWRQSRRSTHSLTIGFDREPTFATRARRSLWRLCAQGWGIPRGGQLPWHHIELLRAQA